MQHPISSVVCLCVTVILILTVATQEDFEDIRCMTEIAERNFKQVQYFSDYNFNFADVDTQFFYSRTKRQISQNDCDCGEGAKNCINTPNRKLCDCENNKIVFNGMCEDCVCHNGICNGETGDCRCFPGFGLENGTCVECDCGQKKQFCHFLDGIQFCNCDDVYISVNSKCEDCVCAKDEICIRRPTLGFCFCPKGSGLWHNECDDKCNCTYLQNCVYDAGFKLLCICRPGKSKLNGTCVDCVCGKNAECEFVDGVKNCTCKSGYELHNGTCEECDCGEGHSCTFKNGSSVCLCAEDHYEHEGTCKECSCGPNERCEIIDGEVACVCKQFFERVEQECKECWCGEGHGCYYVEKKKICLCEEGFSEKKGKCEKCDCGEGHICEFQNGIKKCECNVGYADNKGMCKKCFCGEDSNCLYEDGEKVCICPEGQLVKNGTCTVACLDGTCERGICEVDGNELYCQCENGYTGPRCDQETFLSQGSIYLITVLSAVTLFWIILLLVFIIRKRNRYRHFRNEKFDATMNILSEQNPDSTL